MTQQTEPSSNRLHRAAHAVDPSDGTHCMARNSNETADVLYWDDMRTHYLAVDLAASFLAREILIHCPPCANRHDAIRNVREALIAAASSLGLKGCV